MKMDALKQYTDLYAGHAELIDRGSSPVLNSHRGEAASVLAHKGLPRKGSENYETISLEDILAPDYGLNIARVPIDVNPSASFKCGVPTLSTSIFFNVNDMYGQVADAGNGLPEGCFVGSLKKFTLDYPEVAERYYAHIADIDNPLVALNTMLVQDGIAVYVPKGVKVDKTIQIVNILQNGAPLMAVRRLLVIAEDEASVNILSCDHTQNPDVEFCALQTIEIYAGRNAKADLYDLEESTQLTRRLSSLYLRQESGSEVLVDGMTLYNGITRNEYHTRFDGPNATLKLLGMGIEDRNRQLDTYSCIEHRVADCHTDELFKYVVDDDAVGAFGGLIKVFPGADRTEAYQSNRNIVGSDTARMFSKPQLVINCDDVKCSHGTATGQLDEMQVFYMRTRGLSEQTAKLLLKQAFMADVIEGVRLPGLQERLHMLVERRFAGAESSCSTCGNLECGI